MGSKVSLPGFFRCIYSSLLRVLSQSRSQWMSSSLEYILDEAPVHHINSSIAEAHFAVHPPANIFRGLNGRVNLDIRPGGSTNYLRIVITGHSSISDQRQNDIPCCRLGDSLALVSLECISLSLNSKLERTWRVCQMDKSSFLSLLMPRLAPAGISFPCQASPGGFRKALVGVICLLFGHLEIWLHYLRLASAN